MEITKVVRHTPGELVDKLRRVTMLTDPDCYIYRDVFISLEKIHTNYLAPAQSYVLTGELQKVRELKWELARHGCDLFHLDGYVTLYLAGYDEPVDLLPPVIEESVEADGSVFNIICDGMHRVYLARLEWIVPQVIFIRGVPKDKPYYAYPLPGGWSQVVLREDLPPGFIKKWHRIAGYKSLYRNFNSAFYNVGGPRGHFRKG
ncbi:hypothetical protein [Desulfofundulus thermosubterraneus]|uniref:ParB-like catalytic effector domain-containing protein n=1 Tax=Desulfofundulus thermosubterraneus DSM 16057 TaxID=1121432 RepID=A0A1M6HN15_9FIRM|nr:hypothetical protein [Desulfofundulus thermosubterraneus]SHJ23651.1 hypothetical protein SAMN02745219_02057 [Desulfofundulus thermosubterraneus DSM 16057]